jgi:hypothetical protein
MAVKLILWDYSSDLPNMHLKHVHKEHLLADFRLKSLFCNVLPSNEVYVWQMNQLHIQQLAQSNIFYFNEITANFTLI